MSAALAAGLAPMAQTVGKELVGHAAEGAGGALGGLIGGRKGKKIGRKIGRWGAKMLGFAEGGKVRRPPTITGAYCNGGMVGMRGPRGKRSRIL